MNYKIIVVTSVFGVLGFIITSLWMWVLSVSAIKIIIAYWFTAREEYVKRMSMPGKEDSEYQSMTLN
jgi:hypothetical protein